MGKPIFEDADDGPLTGAALARWCYENPNLAAMTIERLRGVPIEPVPFYGAQCPDYPNCSGGCGLGCTHKIETARQCRDEVKAGLTLRKP
jgi:hypothetical protein